MSIFSPFWTKNWKSMCFSPSQLSQKLWVLVKIWHYQFVPCEIPFLKMYTFMYFYEFIKKLCYKMKMPKREVQSSLTASWPSDLSLPSELNRPIEVYYFWSSPSTFLKSPRRALSLRKIPPKGQNQLKKFQAWIEVVGILAWLEFSFLEK